MLQRTAKSCGPDAPTLASSSRSCVGPTGLRQNISADDGGKGARSPGSAKEPVKTIACGNAGCFRCTRCYSCAFYHYHCTRDRGCTGHPAFPTPSLGARFSNGSGALRGGIVNVCLESRCRHSSCPGKSAKRVFAPDDPGIHQSSQDHFSKKMDCRA